MRASLGTILENILIFNKSSRFSFFEQQFFFISIFDGLQRPNGETRRKTTGAHPRSKSLIGNVPIKDTPRGLIAQIKQYKAEPNT